MDRAEEVPAGAGGREPEVPEKARRRRFEAACKLRIVEEADRLTEPGEVGELLRREGLYSSHWTNWRRQRDEGSLAGLTAKRCGRKAQRKDSLVKELAKLRRENRRLALRLRQAEMIVAVQKKSPRCWGFRWRAPTTKRTNDGCSRNLGKGGRFAAWLQSAGRVTGDPVSSSSSFQRSPTAAALFSASALA